MRQYDPGYWGVIFIFSLRGSTLQKASAWALPCALLTVCVNFAVRNHVPVPDYPSVSQAWYAYTWAIGFLVSFRTKAAYSRWWEGGSLLQKIRGEWFNAYSSLISFCSTEVEKQEPVRNFKYTLARLFSLLHCSSLLTICSHEKDIGFEILDLDGMSQPALEFLWSNPDKAEIVTHWIQQSIVENMRNDVLQIPPAVVSRVFQEISRGMVNFNNVLKISEFLLPFPFAQLTTILLLVHSILTPCFMGVAFENPFLGFAACFISVCSLWSINYTGSEVEQPFGTDQNDLPLHEMQIFMNESLVALLEKVTQTPPTFDTAEPGHRLGVVHVTEYDSVPVALRPRICDAGTLRPDRPLYHTGKHIPKLNRISQLSYTSQISDTKVRRSKLRPSLISNMSADKSEVGFEIKITSNCIVDETEQGTQTMHMRSSVDYVEDSPRNQPVVRESVDTKSITDVTGDLLPSERKLYPVFGSSPNCPARQRSRLSLETTGDPTQCKHILDMIRMNSEPRACHETAPPPAESLLDASHHSDEHPSALNCKANCKYET